MVTEEYVVYREYVGRKENSREAWKRGDKSSDRCPSCLWLSDYVAWILDKTESSF